MLLLVELRDERVLLGAVETDDLNGDLLFEVREHALVALLVQHRHLLGAPGLVHLAALVALSLEQLEEEGLQVLVLASELIVEVVDEGGVAPPLPPRLARRDGLVAAHGEELDQSGLAAPYASARLVDDISEEDVLGRECEVNEFAVVAARLVRHRLAQVLVVKLAVLGGGALELRLGARAQRDDELLVVAAEARHRLLDRLRVQLRNVLLERAVVLLQLRRALGEGSRVVGRLGARSHDRVNEGRHVQ
mmetsp:Transcript_7160/g.17821  ORF Transcript_7160/g.17821 Transcript_7160/m.17821 type:complete len:249 (-) Transcript_7160:80-826(-)